MVQRKNLALKLEDTLHDLGAFRSKKPRAYRQGQKISKKGMGL